MNENIIAEYKLLVFEDGKIKTKQINSQTIKNDNEICSSSHIKQILSVVKKMKSLTNNNSILDNDNIEIYKTSVVYVAAMFEVKQNIISNRMTKELGKSDIEICNIIFDYIYNGSPKLKELLLENINKRTTKDIKIINDVLK